MRTYLRHCFCLFYAFMTFSTGLLAQNERNIIEKLTKTTPGQGVIRIIQDPKITALIGKRGEGDNLETDGSRNYLRSQGYRIQLFMGNQKHSKTDAFNLDKKIKEQFPTLATYVSWEAPFWRVKAGDYKTWEEADQMLRTLRYKNKNMAKEAFIVKSEIRIDIP